MCKHVVSRNLDARSTLQGFHSLGLRISPRLPRWTSSRRVVSTMLEPESDSQDLRTLISSIQLTLQCESFDS